MTRRLTPEELARIRRACAAALTGEEGGIPPDPEDVLALLDTAEEAARLRAELNRYRARKELASCNYLDGVTLRCGHCVGWAAGQTTYECPECLRALREDK